jgi:formylglycine-generating enzyme required for sulfatase activity
VGTFPDSAAVLPDSQAVMLSWKGGDPDPDAKPQYSVYLDTRYPPLTLRAGNLADTSLALIDLKPGTTYWWKVVSSDGIDRSEGPARSFTVRPPRMPAAQPAKRTDGPLAFVPKGSYRREDGKLVQVGPLFLAKYEVTQGEYEKIAGRNPSYHLQDSLPVDRVTWEEADAFCRETGGRLPTEAEWEYAARAGSASPYYWGDADARDYAWFRENSEDRTQKIGLKKPNAWGLHDMAGNVFEWVQDWYGEYEPAEVDHPKGPSAGTAKVIRGASWYSEAPSLGLSARFNNRPGFRNYKVGFRCARDVERAASAAWPDPATLLARKSADALPRPEAAVPAK